MFIENDTTYYSAADYAAKNDILVWIGPEKCLTAMNAEFTITYVSKDRFFVTAGILTWFAESVKEAKEQVQAYYEKSDFTGKAI